MHCIACIFIVCCNFKLIGPQPDWDPDIVAALDDDFDVEDPDNLLDDDFIAKANAPLGNNPEEFKEHSEGEDNVSRYFRYLPNTACVFSSCAPI